ncbi:MAG: methylated-DNA--[protein]-cysteine S-methyltransferase [Coriobacteriia bacterium]|nr:methylated-DNA--[protein]-cysteine S-methyltransferase [Coriobacteriia bacterium]
MYYLTTYQSPVGLLTLASNGEELIGLEFEEQRYPGPFHAEEAVLKDNLPIFDKTKAWLDRYFEGQEVSYSELPLAPAGSEFRQAVWRLLCEIPYGQVTTYGEIAKQMATLKGIPRMASQAVGGAVGHNPISIIIPCHRVVGSDGSLTGFGGGLPVKAKLLELERFKQP